MPAVDRRKSSLRIKGITKYLRSRVMFKLRSFLPVITILTASVLQAQNPQCRAYCKQVYDACKEKRIDDCEAGYRECLKGCPRELNDGSKQDENVPEKETSPKQVIPEIIEKPH